jgi:hypothetical protein
MHMGRRSAILATTLLVSVACSRGHGVAASPKSGTVTPAPTGPGAPPAAAKQSLRDAVVALLTAEEHGDHAGSFVLLSDETRGVYRDIPRWKARRDEVPAVTGFTILGAGKAPNSINVLVDHVPGLDPYRGLSPAQDHQTWAGRVEHGGWLVDGDPDATPVLPGDSGVASAVNAWLHAAESCNAAAVRRVQAVDPLLGIGDAGQQFCGQQLTLTVSAPVTVPPGDMAQQLIAQYSSDALMWARAVTITGAPALIQVVLAPIGAGWQVIGVYA